MLWPSVILSSFVLPSLLLPAAAFGTNAGDEHPVTKDGEAILPGDRVAQLFQGVTVKLDEPVADLAVEMIVVGVTVLVFVDAPVAQRHLLEQSGLDQFAESPINGRPADLALRDQVAQMLHKLFDVKMVVMTEDLFDDLLTLPGDSLAATLQELSELLPWRSLDRDGSQRKVIRHAGLPDLIQQSIQCHAHLVRRLIRASSDL